MADFLAAFERMIVNEGGYRLTNNPADRGGIDPFDALATVHAFHGTRRVA